jgi:hypothetical protein
MLPAAPPEDFAELLRKRARHDVGLAAARERHDQPNGLGRVVLLRLGARRRERKYRGCHHIESHVTSRTSFRLV